MLSRQLNTCAVVGACKGERVCREIVQGRRMTRRFRHPRSAPRKCAHRNAANACKGDGCATRRREGDTPCCATGQPRESESHALLTWSVSRSLILVGQRPSRFSCTSGCDCWACRGWTHGFFRRPICVSNKDAHSARAKKRSKHPSFPNLVKSGVVLQILQGFYLKLERPQRARPGQQRPEGVPQRRARPYYRGRSAAGSRPFQADEARGRRAG